jgi:hypothetical protein
MKKFHVTINAPGIGLVNLQLPRTEAQVSDLRTRYEILDLKQVEECLPNDWSVAVGALGRLVQRSEPELASRAEKALAALLGDQKFLAADREVDRDDAEAEMPRRDTLRGIGL